MKNIFYALLLGFLVLSCSEDESNTNSNTSCIDAQAAVVTAAQNYNAASQSDSNFSALCDTYKTALTNQIAACGDTGGTLQAVIDTLGDCSVAQNNNSAQGVISVTVGALPKTFEENISVELVGSTLKVKAEDDLTNDWVSFEVEQNQTGVDIISNFKIHIISSDYLPASNAGGTFTSSITANTSTDIDGTFSGPVEAANGADLGLTSGVIDIAY